uniref:Uncharacterized protein n=1 Tax=Ditylenchus dipsaci TaxID=166011 RepID=A0A915EN35_9BILA
MAKSGQAGGYVFIVVPHKKRTFDVARNRTTLAELIERHEHPNPPVPYVPAHFSVWVTEDFLELCNILIGKWLQFRMTLDGRKHNTDNFSNKSMFVHSLSRIGKNLVWRLVYIWWLFIPTVYGLFIMTFTKPVLFSGIYFTWSFTLMLDMQWTLKMNTSIIFTQCTTVA